MMKKLFRRGRTRRPGRTTFLRMFLRGMILPVLITLVLGTYLWYMIRYPVIRSCMDEMEKIAETYVHRQYLSPENRLPDSVFLSIYGVPDDNEAGGYLNPESWMQPGVSYVFFTVDESGNIVCSNRELMAIAVRRSEESADRTWYTFDPEEYDIPELKELFAECREDYRTGETRHTLDITQLWIDEETQKMVPAVMQVTKEHMNSGFLGYASFEENWEQEETYQITVSFQPEGYVLTDIASKSAPEAEYPRGSIQGIYGVAPEQVSEVYAECRERILIFLDNKNELAFDGGYERNMYTESRLEKLHASDKEAALYTRITVDSGGFRAWKRLVFIMSALFLVMMLFVFLVCYGRNAKNKAQYAFEDYQRALTNNLAHDLKTPLAVIGGYAETLIQMREKSGDGQELTYLRSIMKNVAYSDEIIRKTLLLGEAESAGTQERTEIDVMQLAEQLAEKYRTALSERGVSLVIAPVKSPVTEGSARVTADPGLMTSVVENLISNAVKYTPDGGSIRITADEKQLSVVNDTAEDVDTKNLTMPFVKGDMARSDKRSSGLGLSIAEAAAERSGFRLRLSCKNKQFSAVLRF